MSNTILAELKETIQESKHQSLFDFDKFNINERDKKQVLELEEVILENIKRHTKSLFEICKSIYEIKLILARDTDTTFVEWYTANGFTKDKISELTKRYELYMQAPDRIEFITKLSIPAVKELTRKHVEINTQVDAIERGLTNPEEIKAFVEKDKKQDDKKKSVKPKQPKYVLGMISHFEKATKTENIKELVQTKEEIEQIQRYLQSIQAKIKELEEANALKNNLALYDNNIIDAEIVEEKPKVYIAENNELATLKQEDNKVFIKLFPNRYCLKNNVGGQIFGEYSTLEEAQTDIELFKRELNWVDYDID